MNTTDSVAPEVSSPVDSLLTGTATKYVLLAVNIALGVFLMPFTLRHLGTAEYGLWMLVASMTYYFQLLDLGYGTGLVRHIAEADARHDIDRASQIVSTFFVVYAGLGLLAAAGVVGIVLFVIPHFPNLPRGEVGRAQVLLGLMGVRVVVGFPMTVFGAATTARQRFALNNTVAIVVSVVNAAVTYAVLAAGYGLLVLVASTTAVGLTSYVAYAWSARVAFPELRIRLSAFSRRLVREVTTYSMYLFVIDVAVQIGFNLDNVVVGAALGTSAIAVYAVTLRLADYQRQLCNQFNGLLFPVVVRFDAAGCGGALRTMLIDGTRIALTLAVGVTVCVIAFADPLILRWMGPGFGGSVAPLYVLALTGVVLVAQGPLGNILLGTGQHRLVAFTAVGEALANLALSVVLVRRFGLMGVAVGTAVPIFVVNFLVMMPAACRQVGMPVADFMRLVGTAPLIGAIPAISTAILLRRSAPVGSLGLIVAEGAATGLVFMAAVLTIGLDAAVRRRYVGHLRRLIPLSLAHGAGAARA